MATCPVVKAIAELRGGWEYEETQTIKIGGSDKEEYVLDDANYYITLRKIDLARFELSRPSDEKIKKFFLEYAKFVGGTRRDIYKAIYTGNRYLYKQFIHLVDIIGKLENTLSVAVLRHDNLNVSIPSITFLPDIDEIILFDTFALEQTMNKIINYVNKLNIEALTGVKKRQISEVPSFTATLDMDVRLDATGTELEQMKKMLEQEVIVAAYVDKLEKYHTAVINHMNSVFDACVREIDALGRKST